VNNPLDIKGNYEHAHGFALHIASFLHLNEFALFLSNAYVRLVLSSPKDGLIIASAFVRIAQNLMYTRCRMHREQASYQTQQYHPAA
jgi:hypothetical protein